MPIEIKHQVQNTNWKGLEPKNFPFLDHQFFQTLEDEGCIGQNSGWQPIYLEDPGKSILFSFIKSHSYGEYIFDWDWANAYNAHQIPYYPKLTSMIPFTSATSPHFIGETSNKVMEEYERYYLENPFSSSHFLFLPEFELNFFESQGYILRDSFQYHFMSEGLQSFDDFLSSLKNKKAKQIRKERIFPEEIKFNQYTGDQLSSNHASEMYQFYLSTISYKNAIPYLSESFFTKVFEKLKNNICYIQATKNENAIAGSLYFHSSDTLYGRYWGATENIKNLHFELCYYQGIEFCIKKSLSVFEAGAQGEHKIGRGFRPVKTYSAHKFKDPHFHHAISEYIRKEKLHINQIIPLLTEKLPFR
ncbi:MAG: hypothetical protein HOE90_01445 [Bacteriovoracaceae bacterium]|jgi:uncharacterized protein|nr:hypothetical protein [Bacteriovoracaceae bacterium]